MKSFTNKAFPLPKLKIVGFSILTIVFLFISTMSAGAKEETNDFLIENGVLVKYSGNSSNVYVPDGVTAIGDSAFSQNTKITKVVLPESVVSIGSYSFLGCKNLSDITLSNSITDIKSFAFSQCSKLASITLPNSLTTLGEFVFSSSTNLSNIGFPSSLTDIGWSAFLETKWLKDQQMKDPLVIVNEILIDATTCKGNVSIPNTVKVIGNYAFFYNKGVTEIIIPDSVTSIQASAFSVCTNLKTVTIPETVTYIGEGAFSSCTKLSSLQLPSSIKSIAPSLLLGCSSLTSIEIPASVTTIGSNAFARCSGLTKIDLPLRVTEIGNNAFSGCTGLTSIFLPYGLTSIGSNAFSECGRLASLYVPSSVTEIGADAFSDTPWLEDKRKENALVIINGILIDATKSSGKVTVPQGVTQIGDRAFNRSAVSEAILPEGVIKIGESAFDTGTLKAITLPKGLLSIGDFAFQGAQITDIQLPDSVLTIGKAAFHNCKQLKNIRIPEGVTTIGSRAFANCSSLTQIIIPKTATQIETDFLQNNNSLTSIQISSENPNYTAKGNCILSKNGTILYTYAKSIGEVQIPEGVQIINQGVFHSSNITKITFPSTLKTLEDDVINSCYNLTEILLPSSLTSFGEQKFEFCSKLRQINVYEANDIHNYISDNGVLYYQDKTTLICNPAKGEIVVPDYVTTIGNYAFPNVDISVTIPTSVTSIGYNIFVNEVYEWTPADEEPMHVYGYTGSAIDEYCRTTNWGVRFLAFDATYTITYKLNSGKNDKANPSSFTYDSDEINFKNPTREGYAFLYWYRDISICNDGCCRGELQVKSVPAKSMGNLELIAKWEKISVGKSSIKSTKKVSSTSFNLGIAPINKADGYEIVYAKNSNFTSAKKTLKSVATTVKLEKLTKNSTYYIKVRAYRVDSTGKKIYGSFSSVKKVKL